MKCSAPVLNPEQMRHRADDSEDPRCQRTASVELEGEFGPRWFCWEHARIWLVHNEIVARIRALGAIY